MSINIRLAKNLTDYENAFEVTKSAWENIPEVEQIPVHIMQASGRTGQFIIAENNVKEVIGYSMSFAQLPSNLYLHAIGVKKEYQSQKVGEKLMEYVVLFGRNAGFNSITLTYNPLLGKNANLFVHKMNGKVTSFEEDMYGRTENQTTGGKAPSDRFLVKIDFDDLKREKNKYSLDELVNNSINRILYKQIEEELFPIETKFNDVGESKYIEVPNDLSLLKKLSALHDNNLEISMVLGLRDAFKNVNEQNPIIDFVSVYENNGLRRNFYVLGQD